MLSWDAFLARYRPMARALAASLCARPTDGEADDVVQEASLALHTALEREPDRFESPRHARNYFLRTVRNLALKTHRADHRGHRTQPLEADPPAAVDDPALEEVRARQQRLGRILRELSPPDRDLITRRFLRRETLAQVAAATGIAISTLHSREKALLSRLRKRLEKGDTTP